MNNQKSKKKKQGFAILAACILMLLLFCLLHQCGKEQQTGLSLLPQNGSLQGGDAYSSEEMMEIMDNSVISFGINAVPYFPSPKAEGNLQIENPEKNNKNMLAEIFLDEDMSSPIFSTKALMPPNSHIQSAKLDRELEPGKYPCTAVFTAYGKKGKLVGKRQRE